MYVGHKGKARGALMFMWELEEEGPRARKVLRISSRVPEVKGREAQEGNLAHSIQSCWMPAGDVKQGHRDAGGLGWMDVGSRGGGRGQTTESHASTVRWKKCVPRGRKNEWHLEETAMLLPWMVSPYLFYRSVHESEA